FASFPGLYEMLPSSERYTEFDFFKAANWPTAGPKVRAGLLRSAASIQKSLAPANADTLLIAGVNRSTVTSAKLDDGECVYESTLDGDGTVPWAFARLEGARTWFIEEEHGALPNNRSVIRAVSQILDEGKTDVLPETPPPARRAGMLRTADSELRAAR